MREFQSVDSIKLESISLEIASKQILSDLNLSLSNNGITAIIGPNGSGKSLTNKILSLLLEPTQGEIKWNDESITAYTHKEKTFLRRQIGYMAQKTVFLKKSLFENIEVPLIIRDIPREQRHKLVKEGLNEFDILEYQNRSPYKLSLGQQQRASFLRTMIYQPQILILDEPTSSLDPSNTLWFENYMTNNIEKQQLVLLTTHDQFQVKRIATDVNFIIGGEIAHSCLVSNMYDNSNNQVQKYLSGDLNLLN
ncbi:MAG: ATP-binding cassette domain-containing protein [Candidatus Heimdallarchaeota archaeon]|nr:ATP-binding cassette domain-containing protein [Candidatus Heimdallarchaeota archaeon]